MDMEHVFDYAKRFSDLYKSKQRLMNAEVEAIQEKVKEGTRRNYDLYQERLPEIRAWHSIWCIINGASAAFVENITEDVWKQAVALLDKYERGKVVGKVLVVEE